MKKVFMMMAIMICFVIMSFGQVLKYGNISNEIEQNGKWGTYETYVTKDGSTYNVGDYVELGMPSGLQGHFVYVQNINFVTGQYTYTNSTAANSHAEIKKLDLLDQKGLVLKSHFKLKG